MKSIYAISLVLLATNCVSAADSPDFAKDVAPVLNKYCVGCHAADEPEADLRLDSLSALKRGGENGASIDATNPNQSLLLKRITSADDPMPPEDEPQPSKAELEILVQWIKSGAKEPSIQQGGENVDEKVRPLDLNTPKVAASDAPKPVTALAHRGTGGGANIILLGRVEAVGVDIISAKGLLVPIPGDVGRNAAPFTFLLSNTPNQITFGSLSKPVKIDGRLELAAKYKGDNPKEDLTINYGDGPTPRPIEFSIAGTRLAVGRFGKVELIDASSEKNVAAIETPGKVNGLSFGGSGEDSLVIATGVAGMRGEAIVCDAMSGKKKKAFVGHNDALYAAKLSRDGKVLATASYDRQIILWDFDSGEQIRTLKGHNGAIYDLDFSPDGKVLASASADATVKIWNVATGERLDTLGQPLKEQYSVDISPDGQFVIAGGEDNRIRLWRLVSKDSPEINPLLFARFAHEGAIHQVRFSPSGKSIVSAAGDDTLKLWSADNLTQMHTYQTQPDSTQSLAMSMDGEIFVGRMDGSRQTYLLRSQAESKSNRQTVAKQNVVVASNRDLKEINESEPNDHPGDAQPIEVPARIAGRIHAVAAEDGSTADGDEDIFSFEARKNEAWIVEVKAAQDKSPLDSHITILDEVGIPVPRVQLQAVRDSYFTFRGNNSNTTGDFRLHNWEEMKLNQFLYADGEVVKLYHYPRGPDSGFNVYPNYGSRRGYFDTTALAHALHAPCYIVEPYPPGFDLPQNGLPTFTLNFENDDDCLRLLGKDSRMTFVAPRAGKYSVLIRDVRGFHGEDFDYELTLRAPEPGFSAKVIEANPKLAPGTGRRFGVQVSRVDGFDGPIDVDVANLPAGFRVGAPLQIEPGHDRVFAVLMADKDATSPSEDAVKAISITASALIDGERVEHNAGSLGKIEVTEKAPLIVELVPDREPIAGKANLPVIEIVPGETTTATIRITRDGHDGRVSLGKEDGAINAPHGVYVANSGLNGVLIVEGQIERQFFISAEPWVKPMERLIFVEAAEAGRPASKPVILRVLPAGEKSADTADQVSR